MSAGFVYLISNFAMPGIYKIGMSERAPHQRLQELSSATCVPMPFQLLCYIEVADCRAVEGGFHQQLCDFRLSNSREFFVFHPENMLFVVGAFKYSPHALAYAEGDLADVYCANGSSDVMDPWQDDGEIHLPIGPLPLTQVRRL